MRETEENMENIDKYLSGDARYQKCIDRYGRDEIIDQIRHYVLQSEVTYTGSRSVFITEKFLICSGVFVIAFEDLEYFDLSVKGAYRRICITAGDNRGELYSSTARVPQDAIGKITAAVVSRAPSVLSGNTPADQLEYKRRHNDAFPMIARECIKGIRLPSYDKRFLLHIRNTWVIVFMAICFIGSVIRIFVDGEKPSQVFAAVFVSLFFGFMTGMAIVARIKKEKGYKAFCRKNTDELLDQLNNRLLYTPNTNYRRAVFVTEKYLFFIGSCVIRREDVLWFYSYTHKNNRSFTVWDKDGHAYSASAPTEQRNWETDEVLIGSLLPNAVTGNTDDNRKYCESHKNEY